ncbi:HAMP domain-containing sensor histidine kinase [Leuconostocaceae bacterium ESL0958]|nr:HAMP domain-containing sensor histidine kinase [Leuconostocaceae bacterium ESL0958]
MKTARQAKGQAFCRLLLGLPVTAVLALGLSSLVLGRVENWSAFIRWPFFYGAWALLLLLLCIALYHAYRKQRALAAFYERLQALAEQRLADLPAVSPLNRQNRQVAALDAALERLLASYQQQAAAQQAVEKSKEEMMENISHDLRTPLTAMIGYLGLVVNGQVKISTADQQKYTETAYHKANQMKTLVEDLFEFAKLETAQVNLNVTSFSLGDLFEQVLANYAMEAKEKHIQLATNLHPRLIVMAGDSDKLARVLINMVENALKYGTGASFIKLTGQIKNQQQVVIRVQNDGPAIPPAAQQQLFDRFYRVEESRNQKTGGTGLGLAIVKGIVDQHGGQITVESDAALTAFVLTLPLKQRKEEQHVKKESKVNSNESASQ